MKALALAVVTVLGAVGLAAAPASASGSPPARPPPPAFVQQATAHAANVSSLSAKPAAAVAAGDRIVVEVGVWSAGAATAGSVTDSAGDVCTELSHFAASDGTELSVWTAPVAVGGGALTVIAKPTSTADVGVAVLEYSGVSSAGGTSVVDVQAHATGKTGSTATVASGATTATTGAGELALGFYADSGFGDAVSWRWGSMPTRGSAAGELAVGFYADSGFGDVLSAGSGYAQRVNVSNTDDMEELAEDQVPASGATAAAATFGTGGVTVWLAETVVFKHG